MKEDMVKYIDDMYEMMATNGWKALVEEAQEAIADRKEQLVRATSIDEVRFVQGEIAQLRNIENLSTIINLREQSLKQEEELETVGVDG